MAPTPSRFAAAEPLAGPAALGRHSAPTSGPLWGRCRGSGAEPYETMVDHAEVAWRCTCPSRKSAVQARPGAAGDVGRAARRRRPPAPPASPVGRRHTTAGPSRPAPAGRGAGARRRTPTGRWRGRRRRLRDGRARRPRRDGRDERVARMSEGLVELDRWLDDRMRTGLADPALARYATWDDLAARLVDARAGALANRVRRLAGVVGARPDWHEVVLAELGMLHLIAAGRPARAGRCPTLADAVATACGWQVRQADVLAGVPDTDTWVVAGRSDTREDRIEVRRVWLRGRRSGRWAMVLSFAAYRQSLDTSLPVGHRAHRRPAPLPGAVRAGARRRGRRARRRRAAAPPPAGTVAEACAEIGRWARPNRGSTASRSRCGRRRPPTGRWVLTDAAGAWRWRPARSGLAALLAASAGRPVDVTVEWTLDGAVPLTVHLPDRAIDIGPVADSSFVSAA